MEPIKVEKNVTEISWADYFDMLVHEAWVESRTQQSVGNGLTSSKVQESGKYGPAEMAPE